MASKSKATIAFRKDILDMIDEESRRRHETRSALVEEALRFWQRSLLERSLAQGYQNMAEEDRQTAESHLILSKEVLR